MMRLTARLDRCNCLKERYDDLRCNLQARLVKLLGRLRNSVPIKGTDGGDYMRKWTLL